VKLRPPAPPRIPPVLEPAADALEDDARLVEVLLAEVAAHGTAARGLELERMRMRGCELDGAQLVRPGLHDVELERCSLAGALIRDATVSRTRLQECRLSGLTWAEGALEDVTFSGCRLDLASFRFMRMQRVVFEDCVLREADFAEARCRFVRFDGCDLTGAGFADARFDASELRGCTLDGITGVGGLRGAALEWAEIVGLAGTLAAALGLRVIGDDEERGESS
jgi:uncharacterized protein YjbI with pentapeptide repeats